MKKLQLLACFMALLLIWGCSESLCGDRFTEEDGAEIPLEQGISLRYQNSSGEWQSMIGIYGPYRWDSVRIYDENWNQINPSNLSNHHFYLEYGNKDTPRGIDIVKTHYIYLTYQDTDTMRHEFKINTSNCEERLAYGRFYYNNQLIESIENENGIPVASVVK